MKSYKAFAVLAIIWYGMSPMQFIFPALAKAWYWPAWWGLIIGGTGWLAAFVIEWRKPL